MAISHSNSLSEQIKDRLEMEDVVRQYGFQLGRSNFMSCPFHKGDRTASLKVYSGRGGFHCFGCGAHGSVIDFVMLLFDLSFRQAVLRLNSDFRLGLTGEKPDRKEASRIAREREQEARELELFRQEYQRRTELYRAMWAALKAEDDTELYYAALKELPILDYWFEEHPYR